MYEQNPKAFYALKGLAEYYRLRGDLDQATIFDRKYQKEAKMNHCDEHDPLGFLEVGLFKSTKP